jgi:hypothetical protein
MPLGPVQNIACIVTAQGARSAHHIRTETPMARTFAYSRVSTLGQTVENQIREIEAAGRDLLIDLSRHHRLDTTGGSTHRPQ